MEQIKNYTERPEEQMNPPSDSKSSEASEVKEEISPNDADPFQDKNLETGKVVHMKRHLDYIYERILNRTMS